MSEYASDIVELLTDLRPADRRAILKRLTREERRRLEALASAPSAASGPAPAPELRITRSTCSPWLARHLRDALEGYKTTVAVSDATRVVLTQLAANAAR
jgi:hypothetical protein